MARPAKDVKVAEVWECPTCQFRQTTPLPAVAVYCPNDHLRKSRKMVIIWTDDGTPPPDRTGQKDDA